MVLVINITGNWPMGWLGMGWKFCPSTHLLVFVIISSHSETSWGAQGMEGMCLHMPGFVCMCECAWTYVMCRPDAHVGWLPLSWFAMHSEVCSLWHQSLPVLMLQPASLLCDSHVCLLRVEIAVELPCWPSLYIGSGDSKSGPCVYVACILVSAILPALQNVFMVLITQSSFSFYILPFKISFSNVLPNGRVCAYACWSQRSMLSVFFHCSPLPPLR